MLQLVQDLRDGKVEVVELPDPVPGAGQVLVRTRFSLISPGTEQAVSRTAARSLVGKARARPDQAKQVVDKALREGVGQTMAAVRARLDDLMTPGYSSMGVVEVLGHGTSGLVVGQRVGCVGANSATHAQMALVPQPLCLPLPEDVDDRAGAFGALGGIALHGVRVAEVVAGDVVVVLGMGLVGQLAAQLVSAAGARVVAVDVNLERIALARELGAANWAALGQDDVEGVVLQASGGHGADSVVVAAASADSGPVELAAKLARDRAIVSIVGDVGLEVPRAPFYEKELQLRLSRSYGPGRYDDAYEREGRDYPIGYVRWTERRNIAFFFEEIAAGRVQVDRLISHTFPIRAGEEAYEVLRSGRRMGILLDHREDEPNKPVRRVAVIAAPKVVGKLHVALVGPGVFARSTLLPLLRRDDVAIRTIAGGSPSRVLSVARRYGAAFAAGDPREVLEDPDVDVVILATRHDSHAELTAQALEAGKAVLVEKPLAIDRAGVERLRPVLNDGSRLVVDFNRGSSPAVRQVLSHFADRRDPIVVAVRVSAGALPVDHWLRDPQRGGGRLIGEGCHFVDLCAAIVGSPVATVAATGLGAGPRTLPGDSFVLTLRYTDGSVATISYVATGSKEMPKEHVEILGASRSAGIDDFRRVRTYDSGSWLPAMPTRPVTQDKGHRALVDAALSFFRGEGSTPTPVRRLLETTEVTVVAQDALTAGDSAPRPVDVEP